MSYRMRILVFSWRDTKHPLAGGAEQVMHEHMKGWITAGHEVVFFSSRFPGSVKEEGVDGVRVIRGGYQYLGVQAAGFWFYMRNRKQFDLVIDQFHGIPFFTPLFVRKLRLAVVQEVARKVWLLNPLPKPVNWLVGLIGYIGEPIVFRLYRKEKFMVGSVSAKSDLVKYGIPEDAVQVVPHGVNVETTARIPIKEKKSTIVFLGVHSKDKGIEDALVCFSLLKKMKKDFVFWTIGKYETREYEKRIQGLVKKLGLEGDIRFWGFVSQGKKFELLARAHVLVNPSVHEGWGLVNIEANAMGTPVVAYRSAGLTDSVKDGVSGIFTKKDTPEEMANSIEDLIEDKSMLGRMSMTAIEWSKRFNWESSRKKSLELIEKLAGA